MNAKFYPKYFVTKPNGMGCKNQGSIQELLIFFQSFLGVLKKNGYFGWFIFHGEL